MIRTSVFAALVAGILSLSAHALIGLWFRPAPPVIEEDGNATSAMLGNSFQDVAGAARPPEPPTETQNAQTEHGVVSPEPPQDALHPNAPSDVVPADATAEPQLSDVPQIARAADVPDTQQTANAPNSVQPSERASQTQTPTAPQQVESAAQPQTTTADALRPLAALPATPSLSALAPALLAPIEPSAPAAPLPDTARAAPTPSSAAQTPPATIAALPEEDSGPAPNLSARPAVRPRAIEEAGEARAEAARQSAARRAQEQQTARQQRQRTPQPQAQNRGSDQGQTAGRTATSTAQPGTAARAGNAAAANYPGLVNRAINRVRRPSISATGRVVVSFSIASSGALASVRLARSSGNARMDQAAVQMIRRARFPKPPPGAKTTFSKTLTWE